MYINAIIRTARSKTRGIMQNIIIKFHFRYKNKPKEASYQQYYDIRLVLAVNGVMPYIHSAETYPTSKPTASFSQAEILINNDQRHD